MLIVTHNRSESIVHHILQTLTITQPDLNNHILGDGLSVVNPHLLPGNRLAIIFLHQLVHTVDEVSISVISGVVMGSHPFLHMGSRLPAIRVYFISANVQELAGEETSLLADHIAEQFINRLEGELLGGVEGIQTLGRGANIRSSHTPGLGVAGYIEFGDDVNTASLGVFDDIFDIVLRVSE